MAMDTDFGNTACTKYEAVLEDYLDGGLNAADAKIAEGHWQNCANCRDALAQAAASVRLLHVIGPSEGPSPAFARTLMARIRAAEQEPCAEPAGFWQPFVRMGWRFAATATLALALLVTYDAGWGRHAQPDSKTARLMDVNELFAPDPANLPANRDEVLMMVADTNHGN